jgi:hypothetical protein
VSVDDKSIFPCTRPIRPEVVACQKSRRFLGGRKVLFPRARFAWLNYFMWAETKLEMSRLEPSGDVIGCDEEGQCGFDVTTSFALL